MNKCLQSGTTITDQMDLLREQVKMLAGEVALSTSSLKRLSEQAAANPDDSQIRVGYLYNFVFKNKNDILVYDMMVAFVNSGKDKEVEG